MKNSTLWRALGRNLLISIGIYGALMLLLWGAQVLFDYELLHFNNPAWCVGIPASIIGVAYILTIRDPQNFTGFFAGIVMSVLLGVQFLLQGQLDSTFLYFFVFVPFQMMSIYKWSRNKGDGGASFETKFLDTPRFWLTIALFLFITSGDYVMASLAFLKDGLTENIAVKLLNGLMISSSFLANYWLIYRKNDAWIYWIIYSVAGIGLFILLHNVFSIVLFIFFLVINGSAGVAWIKMTTKENYGWLIGK